MKTRVQAIRDFFGDVRPVTMDELKALTKQDRAELIEGIQQQTGWEIAAQVEGAAA